MRGEAAAKIPCDRLAARSTGSDPHSRTSAEASAAAVPSDYPSSVRVMSSASTPHDVVRLQEALRDDGWYVSYEPVGPQAPGRFKIVMSHELSGERSFSVPDQDAIGPIVASILGSSEVAAVHRRPRRTKHSVLLGRLRVTALAHRLSRRTLADIGSVLRSVGIISDDEELWLGEAGGAWSDPDESI